MILRRATIEDLSEVNWILTHEEVYPYITDDGCVTADQYTAEHFLMNAGVFVILFDIGGIAFILCPLNTVTYEVHTAIVPESRGKPAEVAAKLCMGWMFIYTKCQKIVSHVPTPNRVAKIFALRAGLKVEGNNEKSFLKDGILYDQVQLGITKEKWLCQQQ